MSPLSVWLQADLYYNRIKEAFQSDAAKKSFNEDYPTQMLDDRMGASFAMKEGRSRLHMMRIWNVYCFLCRHEVFFGESSRKLDPKT